MRILLCHNRYQRAGGEDQVFDDESALLEAHGCEAIRYERHNDEIRGMSRWRVAARTIDNPRTYGDIAEILRDRRPDIVHCTNTFPLISPAVHRAARDFGVPVVQSLHNFRLMCANAFLMREGRVCESCVGRSFAWPAVVHGCYRGSRSGSLVVAALIRSLAARRKRGDPIAAYVALSEFSRRKFIEAGLPAARMFVKPNFVAPDPGMGRGDGDYALFVGRLDTEKGLDVLLDAWHRIEAPIALRVAGDGPFRDRVERAAKYDARITFLGWRRSSEIAELLGSARLLVFPSLWYENCPKTLLESLARGTPVIASRLGAMPEFVLDGTTGLHFRPGDSDDLARAVTSIWNERQQLASMRRAARSEFERRYTSATNHAMLMAIYEAARRIAEDAGLTASRG